MSSIRPWRDIERRKTRRVMVGDVPVGGDSPITVQSMTNTPTPDVQATIDQIRALEEAGADIVRVSCPDEASTATFDQIVKAVSVPIVADIHFHYKRALEAADKGAACLRINPGNIGSKERVAEVVRAAKANGCSIRIGVNGGSLEKHLLENTASLARKRWLKVPWIPSSCSKIATFRTSRFRSKPATFFWLLRPMLVWPMPATTPFTLASPKRVQRGWERLKALLGWGTCSGQALAIQSG